MVDAVPAFVCYVDRSHRYRMCNQSYAARFGLKPNEVVGRTVAEVLGEAAWHKLRPDLEAALCGERREFEADLVYQNGAMRRHHVVYTPQRDAAGHVEGIVVVATDVTSQERTQSKLRETEARFSDMADHSPIMLWVTDAHGACTQLNQRWFEVTGQDQEKGHEHGWLEAIGQDDRAAILQLLQSATGEHRPFRVECRVRQADGTYRWSLMAAAPRQSDRGEFLGYIGSVIDIQDRRGVEEDLRKSRERFDLVKDAVEVGFWFCDLPFDVLTWDNRVKEHFWLPPDATVTIETFYERIHPEDRDRTRAAIAKSIAEKTQYDIEYRTVHAATKAEKWIRAIGRTFYNPQGEPIRFDGVTLDVTQRRKNEDALRDAKELAESASRAKDDFLAQLSHELRTPLTPVLMAAAALSEDEALSISTRDQLKMIARNIELEARLIDDLLDLTRITHGKLLMRAEPCDVHSLLHLVVEIVGEEMRAKKIELTLDLAAECYWLWGDAARLQQVFWNLLRNAVKFTPEGGHVRIHSRNEAAPERTSLGERLQIEISDDGIGFDPADGPSLFQPFERGRAAHDPRFPGLGLGLAIARAIAELHHGRISAASAGPGRGATFTVELPDVRPVTIAGPARPAHPEATSAPKLRLLIVEDHLHTREVLTSLLRRDGHRITAASTVVEALSAAQKETFDLVMSDLGLPDGTGIELMQQLRASHGLRGIALSGYGTDEDLRRTAEAGFVAHLVKPVYIKEVRRVLRSLTS